eukprot:CAMPEP_0202857522 /NCGR_PEP_ID=MMETSP1391-20130828/427_1 /ASSEMBLY_ACC=CAM_ASM_000867 /TAXON_ID=1034604 /ORGANISM="Chlamydomonas leiostraca, Strain SAG 11-49" /LENGTH=796 /DNA_ID=CAMNT_0049536333 /DNA_START=393 /DNA_END=2784 /DNA_ORIENTATION=+
MPRNQSTAKAGSSKASEAKKAAEGSSSGGGGSGGNNNEGGPQFQLSLSLNWLLLGAALYYIYSMNSGGQGAAGPRHEISFQEFRSKLLAKGMVARLEVANNALVRVYVRPDSALEGVGPAQGVYKYYFAVGSVEAFERKLDEAQRELGLPADAHVPVKYVREISLVNTLLEIAPTLLLLGATYWLISRQMRQMTGGAGMGGFGGFGRSAGGKPGQKGGQGGFFGMARANTGTLDKKADKISFKDVAGCDEAKVEIMEFVDFLKKPEKYKELGAKIPKGALLVGPPGTGKTLLAKATAGEAGVPFLSISGSDFMEMFVGVGPARVRDLFAQARTQSPSIIFIDEIDAIGRARGRGGAMGGHDERENTLNQLLVEMDGFATTTGVVVLAGTNRPDILDKALLRPGRFDRTITVDTPDIKGRVQIFRVHLAKLKLTKELDYYVERLAALTPGMSGADIANVCNEAALVAARADDPSVDLHHFEAAIDRVIGGAEKKNKVISAEERRTVAFHESGHAVVSWFLEYAEPLLKVSIVPRGSSTLGFAQYLPNENVLMTKEQLLDRVCAILGGRAAEQVLLGKISTGAVNDLERVTQMAYAQVAVYGMNDKIGLLSYRMDREAFDKPYSNETAHMIDSEVRAFVDGAYKRTLALVEQHRDVITAMSNELLRKEVLNLDDVEKILGHRPFTSAELRNIDRFRHGASKDVPPSSPPGSEGSDAQQAATSGGEAAPKTPESGQDSEGGTSKEGGKAAAGGKSSGGRKVKPGSIVATEQPWCSLSEVAGYSQIGATSGGVVRASVKL